MRLSPGGKSADLADVEVETNSKVDKLVAQGVIAVHEPPKRSTAGKAKKSANPQAGRDKDEGEGDKTTE